MLMPVLPYAYASRSFDIDQAVADEVVTQARNYLTTAAEWLSVRCPHATIEVDVRIADHPDSAIVNAAKDYQADVVALTTHARRGVRLVLGSVADKVLRGTQGSVLVLRPSVVARTAGDGERGWSSSSATVMQGTRQTTTAGS
jgi:nucleotide-binding universal stress UspA family protein